MYVSIVWTFLEFDVYEIMLLYFLKVACAKEKKRNKTTLLKLHCETLQRRKNPYTCQCFAAIEIEHDLIFSSKAQKRGEAFQKLLNLPHVLQRTPLQLWQWVFSLSLPSVSTHWQTVEVFLAVIGFDFRKSVMIELFRHACFA